jgi:hypothetical protein
MSISHSPSPSSPNIGEHLLEETKKDTSRYVESHPSIPRENGEMDSSDEDLDSSIIVNSKHLLSGGYSPASI